MRVHRAGVTLIELIVVIALLGLVAGMTTVSLRAGSVSRTPGLPQRIDLARREAVRTGHPVELVIEDSVSSHLMRALPDGRVLADPSISIDMLTGRLRDAAR